MSRTKAINEKCRDCIYDPAVKGSWRAQVESCTSEKSCSLWPYRPVTVSTTSLQRAGRDTDETDFDALIAGLEDEEDDVPVMVAA